jgi:cytochrome b pre-mRNA-processing protein 3
MFGRLFKQKEVSGRSIEEVAQTYFVCALAQTRQPVFYDRGGVPDSFDGRFDLLLLHEFLILNNLMGHTGYKALSLALFDVTFRNMDQTLREMGIGDMGVPKHMRRMMKAFNGRMHAYQMAVDPSKLEGVYTEDIGKASLREVLQRNLYATLPQESPVAENVLSDMESYVIRNIAQMSVSDDGQVAFAGF